MISGCFISKNEEQNIQSFLDNVRSFLDEIIIIDCFSNDETTEIARKNGCLVIQKEFDGFANVRNFALEKAQYPWRFNIDLDERISPRFADIVKELVTSEHYDGYSIKINHYRLDDDKLIDIGWKKVLFRNYAIYWGDIHERIVSLKHEKQIYDPDIYIVEYKSKKHQFKVFQHYKEMLISLYHQYKSQGKILYMNRIKDCLVPEHNLGIDKWLTDENEKLIVKISPHELI